MGARAEKSTKRQRKKIKSWWRTSDNEFSKHKPHVSMFQRARNSRGGKKARQWSEQNKFTTSHLRHDMARVKNERLCPSISDPSQTAAIPVHGLGHSRAAAAAKSVCHMFFLPSRLMCLLTFSPSLASPASFNLFSASFCEYPKSHLALCVS